MPDSRRWSGAGVPWGLIDDGLVACRDGRIVYAGSLADAPAALDALEVIDCERRWITPGLIDCHTHLVYAGDRAHEFEQRLNGVATKPSRAPAAASSPR